MTQIPAAQMFCPEVLDHIHFKKVNEAGDVAMIDRRSAKMIGMIGQDELSIIALCTGKNSFGSIAEQVMGYEPSMLLEFLQELVAQKIVRFNYV